MNASSSPQAPSSSWDPETIFIYNELLESICSDVIASRLHQLINTGAIPYRDLSSDRRQLYPSLYGQHCPDRADGRNEADANFVSDDEINQLLQKYSVDTAPIGAGANNRTRKRSYHSPNPVDVSTNNDRINGVQSNSTATMIQDSATSDSTAIGGTGSGCGVSIRQQSFGQPDIWGNIPLREPKETIACPICNRQMSALRFAPHLDKCMGISNNRTTTKSTTTGNFY